jgi:hypothetical protein
MHVESVNHATSDVNHQRVAAGETLASRCKASTSHRKNKTSEAQLSTSLAVGFLMPCYGRESVYCQLIASATTMKPVVVQQESFT